MEIKNMTFNLCFKMAQLIPLMKGGGGWQANHPLILIFLYTKSQNKLSIVKFSSLNASVESLKLRQSPSVFKTSLQTL